MASPRTVVRQGDRSPELGLSIIEVRTRNERTAFLRVPWVIYQDDPLWVPPLLAERKEFINPRKHPFYLHGAAAMFIARRDGQPVGRILVSDDPRYNEVHGSNTGCFGMFESIDDPTVAHALLDAAADWLADRGRTHIMGPIDYSTNYTCGLLVDGFDTPPRVMMNYNPRYYAGLLESWGLAKAKDLYGWWFIVTDYLTKRFGRLADRLQQRGDVTIRKFRLEDKEAEVERCKVVYNQAWEHNWGFVKMTDPEFEHFARGLLELLPPELVLLAEVGGQTVGMSLTLLDFNEAMRPLNGKLFKWGLPLGLLQFFRNCRKVKTARLVALGVLNEYRRRGISELLILRTMESASQHCGITHAELGWTLEDNDLINQAIEAVGATHYKTFRIYEKEFAKAESGNRKPEPR